MAIKYFVGLLIYESTILIQVGALFYLEYLFLEYISLFIFCTSVDSGTGLLLGAHQKSYLQLKLSFYKVHDYPGWQPLIQTWNFPVFRTAADFGDNFYFVPCSYHSKDWTLVSFPKSSQKNCLWIPNNCTGLPAKPPDLVTAYGWRQCTKNTGLSFYSWNSGFTYFI